MLRSCELDDGSLGLKPSWVPDWSYPGASDHTIDGRATFGTKARARYLGEGRLRVKGILAAEISSVEDHFLQEPYRQTHVEQSATINVFMKLRDQIKLSSSQLEEAQLVEAFCRTLCMNVFADCYVPAVGFYPYWEQSVEYVSSILFAQPGGLKPLPRLYRGLVTNNARGRCLFTMKDGGIGLGPREAVAGDRVTFVLGCQYPLVLRPDERGNFVVVGECYLDGMMNNEALLGPLPSEWKPVLIEVEAGCRYGFVNKLSNEKTFEDPRLRPLPTEWNLQDSEKKAGPDYWLLHTEDGKELTWLEDPRMIVETLEARGTLVQELLLI